MRSKVPEERCKQGSVGKVHKVLRKKKNVNNSGGVRSGEREEMILKCDWKGNETSGIQVSEFE